MLKKTATTPGVNGVQAALDAEPDYSEAFTGDVKSLAHAISDALSAEVEHDDDMNYSSAQKIVVWLDRTGRPVPPNHRQAAYQLVVYVSSRGHFFTFVILAMSASTASWRKNGSGKPSEKWVLATKHDLPKPVRAIQKNIASIMETRQYTFLDESVLSQPAKGHFTELDGKPATVFEVLFSEVY